MFRNARKRHAARVQSDDAGFTLPELLITVVVSGLLIGVIASAFFVFLRTTPRAEVKLAQSKDVSYLQSWIPADLSSSVKASEAIFDGDVKTALASATPGPSVVFPDNLDPVQYGHNALTLVLRLANGGSTVVSYRYVQDGADWKITRLEINPVTGAVVSAVDVAREIEPAPAGWTPDQGPGHAFVVGDRPGITGRVSKTVTINFRDSSNTFTTTGAGLIAESELVALPEALTPDAPRNFSRCGGNITLMLDTSFSVPRYVGGEDLKSAAAGFVTALDGTPTRVSVMGFDAIAYQLYPNLNGTRGTFFAADDDDATVDEVADAVYNINALPDRDLAGQSASYYINSPGTGRGSGSDLRVGWTQPRQIEGSTSYNYGTGTNWEDAIRSPYYTPSDAPRTDIPRKVVWITDGDPNRSRAGGTSAVTTSSAVDAAAAAAVEVGSDFPDSSIIGVLVGPGGTPKADGSPSDLENNLISVVGGIKWTGSGPDDLQNIDSANYISSTFDDLDEVLKALVVSDCGGVVTVRKSFDDGTTPTGVWTYTSAAGVAALNADDTLSVPISFSFGPGEPSQEVTIFEEGPGGSSLKSAECTAGGLPVASVTDTVNQSVTLTAVANTAISCKFISEADVP